jgi:hypothetical protein
MGQKITTVLVSSDDRNLLHLSAFDGIVDDRNDNINRGSDRPLLGCVCRFPHQVL